MASVSNFAQYGSHLTNLVLGQEKHNYQLIKEDRDHRMEQELEEVKRKEKRMTQLLGPLAGVVGGAAGSGLMNQLGSLFGGGGSPASAMGSDSFGQQASRNIPGGFGNPTYGSQASPMWQNPSIGSNWNYMTGQQNLPY